MTINRRAFLTGLAAIAAVAAIPAPAEARWIGIDFGSSERTVWSVRINGKPVKIVSTSPDGNIWTDLPAGDLTPGRLYKLELRHEEELVLITDFQLVSDQGISEPVEGKSKQSKWRHRNRLPENGFGRARYDGPAFSLTPEARQGSFFASHHG